MNPGNNEADTRDTGLEEVEAAYRSLPAEEPPALVDQAVLNRARLAVEGRAERPWSLGWIHALSTAVIVVLGVAIVLHEPAPPADPLRVALPPSGKLRDIESEIQPIRMPANPAQPRRQGDAAKPGAAAPATRIAREVQIHAPAPAPSGQPSASRLATTAAAPAATDRGDADGVLGTADMADAAPHSLEAAQQEAVPDPAAWIERLLRLKSEGKLQELQRQLEAFRAAYPGHALPPELAGE